MEIFHAGCNRYKIKHNFLQYFDNTYFRNLVYDGFFKFSWERFHDLLEILLNIVSLHLKSETKYTQTSKKETFHKQSVVILLKYGCSVRHMFCTNLFIYLWPKFFKNTFEVVHTSNWSFSRKIHIHMDNLLNGYFYYNYFRPNFSTRYFPELHLKGNYFV